MAATLVHYIAKCAHADKRKEEEREPERQQKAEVVALTSFAVGTTALWGNRALETFIASPGGYMLRRRSQLQANSVAVRVC